MFIVFRILLILTHFTCDLFAAVYNCYMSLHRKCTQIWYRENLRTEAEMLITIANKKKKLPRHIVVVFGTMENTIFDCIRIIGWCITLGIPYISFFDINGNNYANRFYLIVVHNANAYILIQFFVLVL